MSWQDKLRVVEPYVAGEQPAIVNMIKLNTNENPYGPTPKVKEVLETMDIDKLRLYPSSDAALLRQKIANYYQVEEDQVFLGNGSDEVLALSFLTFFNSDLPILFPDITYSFYPVYCDLYQMKYVTKPVDTDFKIHKEDYYQPNAGIIFPNPNAPTGVLMDLDSIEDIIIHNQDSVVIIDEAYIDFGGTSALPLLKKYDNVVIIQTYSKSRALAGMRLGIALGNNEVIARLYDVKNSFNSYPLDTISQLVGIASIEDDCYFKQQVQRIIDTREYTKDKLKELGFIVPDSYANFVFVKHPMFDAKELFMMLREKGIIVRHWNKEKIDQYLRISIGSDQEMETLIQTLKQYIEGNR